MDNNKGWNKTVAEVSQRLNDPDVYWLDVREPDEFSTVRIPGAKLIPMAEVPQRIDELDPHMEIIVICLSGGRSGIVTAELRRRGFDKAYNLDGGMVAWVEQNLPVEQGPEPS